MPQHLKKSTLLAEYRKPNFKEYNTHWINEYVSNGEIFLMGLNVMKIANMRKFLNKQTHKYTNIGGKM